MTKKHIIALCLFFFFASLYLEAWAGELVWGPKRYTRDTGTPIIVKDSFIINQPTGKFYIYVKNGGSVRRPDLGPGIVESTNQASSAYIKLNDVQVIGPRDLNQNIFGVEKDITYNY